MSENKTTASSPEVHLLEFSSPCVSTRPASFSLSLSPLYNPLEHPSFLAVISFPMLSASACFDFIPLLRNCLFVPQPYLLSVSPLSLPPVLPLLSRALFGELFISLCMSLISTCSKDMIGGAAEVGDGRGDIDLLRWRTRRGGK